MSPGEVKSFEVESFKAKLSQLAESKAVDDTVFADVIYIAMSRFAVDEEMFRDAFGLTRGAVDRWTQCQNLPQQVVRPKIMGWIKSLL